MTADIWISLLVATAVLIAGGLIVWGALRPNPAYGRAYKSSRPVWLVLLEGKKDEDEESGRPQS